MGQKHTASKSNPVTSNDYKPKKHTIFLIGLKSSGKSTIRQQIQNIFTFGPGMPLSERISHIDSIRRECILSIIYLLKIMNDNDNISLLNTLSIHNSNDLLQIKNTISSIWKHYGGFVNILSYSHLYNIKDYQFNDNIKHFIDNISRIMSNNFCDCISFEDIIKYKTNQNKDCNIFPYKFHRKEREIEIIDVGIKYELKNLKISFHKYSNCACESIHYIVSLSDYCEYIIDSNGNKTNAMQYSLAYFNEIIHNKHFKKCEIIVILNKIDRFQERLRNGITLSECFGDKWKGLNYTNDKQYNYNLISIISCWIRNIEIKILLIIPDVIKIIIINYAQTVAIDNNGDNSSKNTSNAACVMDPDRKYFNECYQQGIKFIKQEFSNITKHSRAQHTIRFHVIEATSKDSVETYFNNYCRTRFDYITTKESVEAYFNIKI